jgi:hypothetical protein
MLRSIWTLALLLLAATACDMGKFTVNTTAKVLVRAAPAMEMESDWELAARAIPATLKTVEGFHLVNPDNADLTKLLAQGYCQYATGFIEDEFEVAEIARDTDAMEAISVRATKSYLRCMNYGLELLGKDWKRALEGDLATLRKKVASAGGDQRTAMMWVAIGLGGAINYNRDDIALVSQLPKARVLLERVVAIDAGGSDAKPQDKALPHIALGMMHTAMSAAMGGNPELAAKHFKQALEVTHGRFLLAKVLYARRYAVARQDRALFRKTLLEVLATDPAIWPEQRLANEIAHRRARRYLKREKELF